ncbi:Uncharacterised protein [Salmonella enterica subsp. enterica serovar Bovismorbificans]|nr:Uncharacterised protein [Salmonella enterica subsp. enterica serovar Bovismorbificans]CNU05888.1 Uncharacterised protein [Salmonella enterica subsp. enterica serovar Bovismorbificans]CNU24363.1 Uncharacterised protein [Salmonella enterica subsp. enterica serovar Bovismorbificans]CPR53180.1 Uncharacterised protein [Salmonella enterica subsp. enterica serovar Bovismorbificans]CQB61686.1 Uncharacterised protein [Salmonella enterica subsp. enterica serovar Bovismorbificans]
MTLNVVANAPQTFGISRADQVIHHCLLVAYSAHRAAVNPDRSCAMWDYGFTLRICFTSISTEFQSLSTSP